jgi:hypothetical protein
MTEQNEQEGIITPVALGKELNVRPQLVFSWVRAGKFPTHQCVCGHTYLLRDEIADFLTARDAKQAEKDAKVAKELEDAKSDSTEAEAKSA